MNCIIIYLYIIVLWTIIHLLILCGDIYHSLRGLGFCMTDSSCSIINNSTLAEAEATATLPNMRAWEHCYNSNIYIIINLNEPINHILCLPFCMFVHQNVICTKAVKVRTCVCTHSFLAKQIESRIYLHSGCPQCFEQNAKMKNHKKYMVTT